MKWTECHMITKSKWKLLGIEPTTDIRQIKKAYAKALKLCSPEENPIKFQKLREAYKLILGSLERRNSTVIKPDWNKIISSR